MGTIGRTGGEIPLGEIRPEMNVQTAQVKAAFASKPQALPLSKSVSAESTTETKRTPEAHEKPKAARIFADLATIKGLENTRNKVVKGFEGKTDEAPKEPDEQPPPKMIFR